MRLISSPQLDRPLPGRVDLANLLGRVENRSPGREIGPLDVLHQPLERQLAVVEPAVQQQHQGIADLLQVVGRDVRRHPDGDSRGPVDQQVGKLGRQDFRLLVGRRIVRTVVDGLFADLAQQRLGDGGQPALGVPHGRRGIAVDRAEIAIALDQRVAQAERLGHPHQGVVDRLVAVGMVGLHHLTHHGRRLDVPAVRREVQVRPHRVQDAPLHRLQAVADIGQGSRGDHAERVIEIARPRRLRQRNILHERVTPRPSVLAPGLPGGSVSPSLGSRPRP